MRNYTSRAWASGCSCVSQALHRCVEVSSTNRRSSWSLWGNWVCRLNESLLGMRVGSEHFESHLWHRLAHCLDTYSPLGYTLTSVPNYMTSLLASQICDCPVSREIHSLAIAIPLKSVTVHPNNSLCSFSLLFFFSYPLTWGASQLIGFGLI